MERETPLSFWNPYLLRNQNILFNKGGTGVTCVRTIIIV